VNEVFVDTSAVIALRSPRDRAHRDARRSFARLAARQAVLVTTSYVLCEIYALLGRRFGLAEIQAFRTEFSRLLRVRWVDARLHELGLDFLAQRRRRGLSLVDAVSFVVMRDEGLEEAFAFDRNFLDEGFRRP